MRDDARFCTIPCVTLPFPPPVPGVPPVRKRAVWLRRIGPARDVLILLVILGLGAVLSPTTPRGGNTFLQPGNLTDALRAVAPVGIAALAMTLVILTGGIDLSVGSAAALAGVVAGRLLVEWHPGWPLGIHVASAMGLALLGCGAAGMLNGAVIAALRIQPFVITLASMIGVRGLALWLANNERIGLGVGQDAPGTFGAWLSGKAAMIGIWAVLALVAVVVLERTVFGRYVRALGDNPEAAQRFGQAVGVTDVRAGLLPEQKLEAIKALAAEHGQIAMIGDGVNDAPALAAATVGIAMGGAGTAVALETADVALMADDLSRLPFAVGLSRASRAIIRQNLAIALSIIVLLIMTSVLGLVQLGGAVILHEGSTIVVVLNALRLLRFQTSPPAMSALA